MTINRNKSKCHRQRINFLRLSVSLIIGIAVILLSPVASANAKDICNSDATHMNDLIEQGVHPTLVKGARMGGLSIDTSSVDSYGNNQCWAMQNWPSDDYRSSPLKWTGGKWQTTLQKATPYEGPP